MQDFQDIFISYGRRDSLEFAARLNRRLVDRGFTVWFDYDDIPLGVDYQKQIDDGIERADNILFIISPHSINSPYCGLELELALKRGKRIIPLLHVERISYETWQQRNPSGTEAEWAEYQAKGLHDYFQNMHPVLRKLNWIYAREGQDDFEAAFSGLLDLCDRHHDYVHQHTLLLAKALEWERNQKRSPFLLIGEERLQAEDWLKARFKDSQPPCLPTDLHCEFITESRKNADNLFTDVFLAYAEEERTVAEQIRNSLRRAGFTVWTNTTDIEAGADFQQVINRGIEEADNVVYLLSSAAVRSPYCQHELDYALLLHKRTIPVRVEAMAPEEIPAQVRELQYIDLTDNVQETDYQQDESQLLHILRQDAAYHETHKLLLTKALKWQRQQQNPTLLLRGYNLRQAEAWLKVAKQNPAYLPLPLQETFITESLRQPPGLSLDVFISYSRADSGFARKLNDALQIQGKRTWFDQESIAAGTADFQQEIYKGIESSDTFLFVLSPRSVTSPYCADEVEYAASLNKRVVTILHQAIDPSTLHPELAKVQWLDFNRYEGDFSANFTELLRLLDTDVEHLQIHTRLLLRAIDWDSKGRKESLLLRDDELADAEQWLTQSADKEPKPTELQQSYIASSRAVEDANQQASQILQAAAAKGSRLVRLGALAGSIGLLIAVVSGWMAFRQVQGAQAKVASAQEETKAAQQEKANAEDSVRAAEVSLKTAETNVKRAEARERQANDKVKQADQQLAQAEVQVAAATQQARAAQQEGAAARAATEEARNQQQAAQREAREARETQNRVQKATQLERRGSELLRRSPFQFQQIDTLLEAMRLGQDLQQLLDESPNSGRPRSLDDYPARNPLLALRTSVNRVLERNRLPRGFISEDGQLIGTTSADNTTSYLYDRTSNRNLELQGGSLSFSLDGQLIGTTSADGTTSYLYDRTSNRNLELQGGSLSFSPDGQLIGTTSADGTTSYVYDRNGVRTLEVQGGSPKFSPDGQLIVTTSADNTTSYLYDRTSDRTSELQGGSPKFSPDGQLIVTTSADGSYIYDRSGNRTLELQGGYPSFSPNGQLIGTNSSDGSYIYDRSSNRTLELQGGYPSFSPNGQLIGTNSSDGSYIYDRSSNRTLELQGSYPSFSPNGQLIGTTSADNTTSYLYDRTSDRTSELQGIYPSFSPNGQLIGTSLFGNTASYLYDRTGSFILKLQGGNPSFSPDGQLIVTSLFDGTSYLYDRTGNRSLELGGFLGFSLDGQLIVTISSNGSYIYDRTTNRTLELQGGFSGFSLDGQLIVTTSADGTASYIYDRSSNRTLELQGGFSSFSPDGQLIGTTSADNTTSYIYDRTGSLILKLQGDNLSFSPDGQLIGTTSADGTASYLHNRTDNRTLELQGGSPSFSPDGQLVVTTSSDNTSSYIYDRTNNRTLELQGGFSSFSPDGQLVVTTSFDNTVSYIYDRTNNRTLELQGGYPKFSPDGQLVGTTSSNGSYIYDHTNNRTLELQEGGLPSFSSDGRLIVTTSSDGSYIYDRTGNLILKLQGISPSSSQAGQLIGITSSDGTSSYLYNHANNRTLELQGGFPKFSGDGQLIATTAKDEPITYLYDRSGVLLAEYPGSDPVFTPDGAYLITYGADNIGRFWRVDRGLDDLLAQGCEWLRDYFVAHPEALEELSVCQRTQARSDQ